jgi:pyrroline-5-carboxylate reductase
VVKTNERLAILGCGNIGSAIARGLARSGRLPAKRIIVTRRKAHLLAPLEGEGFTVQTDNLDAVRKAKVIVLAVDPQHTAPLTARLRLYCARRHVLVSIVSGVGIVDPDLSQEAARVRAMQHGHSDSGILMTCLPPERL